MDQRLEAHDGLWLRCRALLKEGTIPIETFDNMTRKRIMRIVELQEQILDEQRRQMENERKKQDREFKNMNK